MICEQCGGSFIPDKNNGWKQRFCERACRLAWNRDNNSTPRKPRYRHQSMSNGTKIVTILSDPTPIEEGGFAPMSRLAGKEFDITLHMGYFASGTRVRIDGKIKTVREKELI